jgi:hypothetical protein
VLQYSRVDFHSIEISRDYLRILFFRILIAWILHSLGIFGSLDKYRYKYSKMWFISKARYVQLFEEDFAAFIAAFVPAFPAAFAPAFPAALASTAAACPAAPASAFAFAGWDLDFYLSFWQVDLGKLLKLIEVSKIL